MRAKHTSQDLGQTLIFTYKHWHDCLTDNKCQKGVGMTVSQHIMLIDVFVSELSALSEEAKKIKIKIKVRTSLATMNFKLRPVRKGEQIEPKGKSGARKFHTKPWNSKQTNRRIGSPLWSPIFGQVKLWVQIQTIPLAR